MHSSAQHVSAVELEQGLAEVIASPAESGELTMIFIRPATNERRSVESATLTTEGGIDGDHWATDGFYNLPDGGHDPRCQVSIMNARFLRQAAMEEDAMCLAGDNLIVDLDLSEANLPAESRLAIGPQVVVELTDLKHSGCGKFARRYGNEAKAFTNDERGMALHLRGRYARIVREGTISVGDVVRKVATE
jgi:MOSC domain-containing protein YiiM